jgi:hypothetical protein
MMMFGPQMRRVGDGLGFGPDPGVDGDRLPVADHSDPVQVGADLDAPCDHRGVDGSGALSDRK